MPSNKSKTARKAGGSNPHKIKSLNYDARKQEYDRIHEDNLKLFARLSQSKGKLSKREFDKDYKAHKKYMQTMTKAPMI